MKSFAFVLLPAVLGLAASGCSSASLNRVATHTNHELTLPLDEQVGIPTLEIRPGNHRDTVLTQLGVPAAIAGPDIWIYDDVRSADPDSRTRGYNTLVVTFEDNRVSLMRMVEGHRIRELLARLDRGRVSPPTRLAAAP